MHDPDVSDEKADEDRVQSAAELGGASEFIQKLPQGMNQQLDSCPLYSYSPGLDSEAISRAVLEKCKKTGRVFGSSDSLSGGEQQRIALFVFYLRFLDATI